MFATAMPISVAAAPSGAAYAKNAMSMGVAAYAKSGAVTIISEAYARSCDTVPTPTSVIGINAPIIIPGICQGTVCIIGRSRIPVVRGGESGSTIIRRTITIIAVAAGTLRLGHACRQ